MEISPFGLAFVEDFDAEREERVVREATGKASRAAADVAREVAAPSGVREVAPGTARSIALSGVCEAAPETPRAVAPDTVREAAADAARDEERERDQVRERDEVREARKGELLDLWVDAVGAIAKLEAVKAAVLAERFNVLVEEWPPGSKAHDAGFRSVAAEFAAAVHMSAGTVESAFLNAHRLMQNLPLTAQAYAEGKLSARHVTVIVAASHTMATSDPGAYAAFDEQVVGFAVVETAARTDAFAKSVAAAVAPQTMLERHRSARQARMVRVFPLGDGMAELCVTAPEIVVRAGFDRLTALARAAFDERKTATTAHSATAPLTGDAPNGAPGASDVLIGAAGVGDVVGGSPGIGEGDERTFAQIRADIFMDLVLLARPETISQNLIEGITAQVQVTIAASTLTGDDDRMAELDGHGPVHPDFVRELAGHATSWHRLFLDPAGLTVSTDSYTPTAGMKRLLRARDQHCRFPGCRTAIHRCEIDHTFDHARGGKTTISNLAHLCKKHHGMKHPDIDDQHRWSATQQPGGTIVWCSPTGRTYTDDPTYRVMFI